MYKHARRESTATVWCGDVGHMLEAAGTKEKKHADRREPREPVEIGKSAVVVVFVAYIN
jgi:hypothetical protein